MKKIPNVYLAEQLYQNLGKLFYAVAAADRVVKEEEEKTLKRIVKEEWVKLEDTTDEYGIDAAYRIEVIFDFLKHRRPDSNQAFEDFKKFKKEHEHLFDEELKNLIWRTAGEIALAFARKNKSELILLSKLKMIL